LQASFQHPLTSTAQIRTKSKEMILGKQKGANRGDGHLEELFTTEFTMEELKEALKNISNKKQPGPDKIFPEYLKPWPKSYRLTALSM
jgi:hypothetical protein